MKLAELLIDKAAEVCGSYSELARRIEAYPTDISKLRAGKRPLSPEIAAEIAEIAGMDARQAAIDAIIERNAENRKGEMLRNILGKALVAGVVGMSVFSYSSDSYARTNASPLWLTGYTSYQFGLRRIKRRTKRVLTGLTRLFQSRQALQKA